MASVKGFLNMDEILDGSSGGGSETNMKLMRECIQELHKDNAYDFVEENVDELTKEDLYNLLMGFIELAQENELEQDEVAEHMQLIYFQQ